MIEERAIGRGSLPSLVRKRKRSWSSDLVDMLVDEEVRGWVLVLRGQLRASVESFLYFMEYLEALGNKVE